MKDCGRMRGAYGGFGYIPLKNSLEGSFRERALVQPSLAWASFAAVTADCAVRGGWFGHLGHVWTAPFWQGLIRC
jgi:hypothetical protein